MASDHPRGTRPAPVVLRIKLRYDDVDAMVAKFAPNVGKSGLFLPTKSLQAVLAPASSKYLYFVVRGDRRHAFSETLEEHNTAVKDFRERTAKDH